MKITMKLAVLAFGVLCFASCNKEPAASGIIEITTAEVSEITSTSAVSGGNVISDGGVPVTAYGVCWSTKDNPTTADSKTSEGEGLGTFVSTMTGLEPGVTY